MEQLRCVVERITYQNEQNGYTVLKCRASGWQDLITVVGNLPEVHVGSVWNLRGSWHVDAKYGRQFAAESCEEALPATVYGIEKYLGSGLVKGIGPKYARRIVNAFGTDTLTVIGESPERLLEVPGIGRRRVEMIKKSWHEQQEIRNIMLFLQEHDVSTTHAAKIFKTYGEDSIRIVKENPYRLADDIWGIGFRTADGIAEKMGFQRDRYPRLRSGLMYALNALSEEGHCFAVREQLENAGAELLSVDRALLREALDGMISAGDVIVDGEAIYLPVFYHAECGTARRLQAIQAAPASVLLRTAGLSERVQKATGRHYDEAQTEAIRTAAENKLMILTGGPGTGKTTTTLGIITVFREAGAKILLAAPTGRAAKRLSEATGMEARTIHRLLEVKPPEGYQRNEEKPLEGDVMILDECSMVDILLMYHLLKAVPNSMRVILVGDVDQLPSVGPGSVLRDVIESGCFPVVRLTRIFRQAQKSRIMLSAHRVNRGQMPDLSNGKNTDFFFLNREDPEAAAETISELVKTKLPQYFRMKPQEIQVLSPMQRGAVGSANLNRLLQETLNPEGPSLSRGGILYRVRDKVMQIRNNYDKEVFNGDIGIIERVDPEDRMLTVCFDGRSVAYESSELDELSPAYATTIHKAQGSEYPVVVMPVLMTHYVMLQRNLIYTGITRAKKGLVMVGSKKALYAAIRNVSVTRRNTKLKERLRKIMTAP